MLYTSPVFFAKRAQLIHLSIACLFVPGGIHTVIFLRMDPEQSDETNQQLVIRILKSPLSKKSLCVVIKWAAMIDDEAFQFWHR